MAITCYYQQRLSDLIGPGTRGTYRIVYRVLQPLLASNPIVFPQDWTSLTTGLGLLARHGQVLFSSIRLYC